MKKKNIAVTATAVILAVALVLGGGTMAYLSGQSEEAANTFTPNSNSVKLEETTGGSYDIVPGTSQDKDPTVTATYTLDSYVFLEVVDSTGGLVDYEIEDGWILLSKTESDGTTTYVYYQLLTASDVVAQEIVWAQVESTNIYVSEQSDGSYYIWDKDDGTISYYASTGATPTDVTAYFDLTSGNITSSTTTVLGVLKGNQVSYSSTLINGDMDADSTVALTFQAYIIQAQLSGTTGESYADAATAYQVVTTGASYYNEGATYVALDADSTNLSEDLSEAITAAANNSGTTVIVLPKDSTAASLKTTDLTTAATNDVALDLNGSELTVTGSSGAVIGDGGSLTIANGEVDFAGSGSTFVALTNNSAFMLENVDLTTSNTINVEAGTNTAELNIINSTITSTDFYCVSTNAAEPTSGANVVITIENSTLSVTERYDNYNDSTGILFNVSGTLNIINSEISGQRQGVIVRAGTANISNSIITTLATYSGVSAHLDGSWSSGNEVPVAALVVGNLTSNSYPHNATVTLSNVTLSTNGNETVPAIYAASCQYATTIVGASSTDTVLTYTTGGSVTINGIAINSNISTLTTVSNLSSSADE